MIGACADYLLRGWVSPYVLGCVVLAYMIVRCDGDGA